MARVNEGSHIYLPTTRLSTSGINHACLYSEPQSVAALWPVLIFSPGEG